MVQLLIYLKVGKFSYPLFIKILVDRHLDASVFTAAVPLGSTVRLHWAARWTALSSTAGQHQSVAVIYCIYASEAAVKVR